MVAPLAIGVGLGVAGAAANYIGGRQAARARQRAIRRWQEQRTALLDQLGTNAWEGSRDRAATLSAAITGLNDSQETAGNAVATPTVERPTGAPGGSQDYLAAYLREAGQAGDLADTELAADAAQARVGRGRQGVGDAAWKAGIGERTRTAGRSRRSMQLRQAIAQVDAELARLDAPDSAYAWQTLGGLLNAGSQGTLYAGARS
jgi:hypothetical protein